MSITNLPELSESLIQNPRRINDVFVEHAIRINAIDDDTGTAVAELLSAAQLVVADGVASATIPQFRVVGIDTSNGSIFPWEQLAKPMGSRPIGWAETTIQLGEAGVFSVGGLVESTAWPTIGGTGLLVPNTLYYVNDNGNLITSAQRQPGATEYLFGLSVSTTKLLLDRISIQAPNEVTGDLNVGGSLSVAQDAKLGASTYVATQGQGILEIPGDLVTQAGDQFVMEVVIDGAQPSINVAASFLGGETSAQILQEMLNQLEADTVFPNEATAEVSPTNLIITSNAIGPSSMVQIGLTTFVIGGVDRTGDVFTSSTPGLPVSIDTITLDGRLALPIDGQFGDIQRIANEGVAQVNVTDAALTTVFHSGTGTLIIQPGGRNGQYLNITHDSGADEMDTMTLSWPEGTINGVSLGSAVKVASGVWDDLAKRWTRQESI